MTRSHYVCEITLFECVCVSTHLHDLLLTCLYFRPGLACGRRGQARGGGCQGDMSGWSGDGGGRRGKAVRQLGPHTQTYQSGYAAPPQKNTHSIAW